MLRARPTLTAVAVAAVAVFAVAGCARSGGKAAGAAPAATVSTDNGRPQVAARGVGLVKGTPDTLRVVLGVETHSVSAQDALAQNNDKANALIDTLKKKGVEAKDIQTSQLSINPTYDNQGRRITGYQVDNQVTATLHDLAGAGGLIDAAAAAVGDAVRVQSMGFSIDDDSALKAEARTQAVHLAQLQAEQMAKAAGVKLGAIRLISEVPANSPAPYYGRFGAVPSSAAAGTPAPAPVEPGQQELSLTVDVVWDIAQ
ncbi:MAG TPA: SIMPL domain-containing protein [Acidimicrobiia bacterium]|nr:SIMPL domain-containing protein [Acidimicrobiia bacterium]